MLRIFVNNESLDFKAEKEENIGELMGEIEAFCNKNGHSVYKIFLGEDELSLEKLDEIFAKPVNSDMELNLFTLSADDIKESLNEIKTSLFSQAESLKEVGVKMQTNEDGFVLCLIAEISKNLKTLFEYLGLLERINVDTSSLEGESILEKQGQINEFLQEITVALEEKDIITVSDLSEYELSPLLESLLKEVNI